MRNHRPRGSHLRYWGSVIIVSAMRRPASVHLAPLSEWSATPSDRNFSRSWLSVIGRSLAMKISPSLRPQLRRLAHLRGKPGPTPRSSVGFAERLGDLGPITIGGTCRKRQSCAQRECGDFGNDRDRRFPLPRRSIRPAVSPVAFSPAQFLPAALLREVALLRGGSREQG